MTEETIVPCICNHDQSCVFRIANSANTEHWCRAFTKLPDGEIVHACKTFYCKPMCYPSCPQRHSDVNINHAGVDIILKHSEERVLESEKKYETGGREFGCGADPYAAMAYRESFDILMGAYKDNLKVIAELRKCDHMVKPPEGFDMLMRCARESISGAGVNMGNDVRLVGDKPTKREIDIYNSGRLAYEQLCSACNIYQNIIQKLRE